MDSHDRFDDSGQVIDPRFRAVVSLIDAGEPTAKNFSWWQGRVACCQGCCPMIIYLFVIELTCFSYLLVDAISRRGPLGTSELVWDMHGSSGQGTTVPTTR